MSVGIGRIAAEKLRGRIQTVRLYEGSFTDQTPITGTGANRVSEHDAYQPSAWLKTGYMVKEYASAENTYQFMAAADDMSLARGIIVGEITRDPANAVVKGKVQFFTTGDILKVQCDASHSAIAVGDPVTVDAIQTATGTSYRYGITVDVAAGSEDGFGYALNALAASTAGFIKLEWVKPQYEYISGGVNGNITIDVFPLGMAQHAGKVVNVSHEATSQAGAGAFNITVAGSDIFASDEATVAAATNSVPDQNQTVAQNNRVLLDVSNAGTTVVDFTCTVKILSERVM